jgi:hypothetical protein
MIDLSLIITIRVIFFLSLTAAYLRTETRDRCLNPCEDFHVTLVRASGKLLRGNLPIVSTGVELVYTDTVQDERHLESSSLYAGEYGDIEALYRYFAKLSDENKQERAKDIDSSFQPGPARRYWRNAQNFLGTATDSLNEVFGLVLGRAQKTRQTLDRGGWHLLDVEPERQSAWSRRVGHDQPLERYIGSRVVIELWKAAGCV